jgi:hypothetical protein
MQQVPSDVVVVGQERTAQCIHPCMVAEKGGARASDQCPCQCYGKAGMMK